MWGFISGEKRFRSLETVITSCRNDYQILHWHIVTTTVNEWFAPIYEVLNAPMHARKLLECTINCAGDNIDWWYRNVIDNAEHAKKHLTAVSNTNQVISVLKRNYGSRIEWIWWFLNGPRGLLFSITSKNE